MVNHMKIFKKFLIILLASILPISVFGMVGCAEVPQGGSISHNVNFIVNGELYKSVAVSKGDRLSVDKVPAPPEIEGYDVIWSPGALKQVTEQYVDSDKAVDAIITAKTFKVSYNLGNGEHFNSTTGLILYNNMYTQEITYGESYSLYLPEKESVSEVVDGVPTTFDFVFTSWCIEAIPVANSGTWNIAKDVVLTPSFRIVYPDYYELIFYHGENNSDTTVVQVDNGEFVDPNDTTNKYYDKLPDLPTETGYDFYWGDRDGNPIDFSTINRSSVVIACKTPKTYTITFKTSQEIPFMKKVNKVYEKYYEFTQEVTFGAYYTLPKPLTSGYELKNWVIEGTDTVFRYGTWSRDEDVVLQAVWIDNDYSLPY